MAADLIADMSDEDLLAGTTDEKIDRMLLLFRDGYKDMKDKLAIANRNIKANSDSMAAKDQVIVTLQRSNEELKSRIKNLEEKQDNEHVLSDYHNKKYNMIIVNMEESTNTAWESNVDSIDKVYDLFQDLGVENARSIPLVNAHRMGLRKSVTDPDTGATLHTRPLIVRFASMPGKEKVQKKLGALKEYNRNTPYKYHRVFETEQLPKRMDEQRKKLLDKFISARRRKAKAKWSVDKSGNYCLYVDNEQVFASAD